MDGVKNIDNSLVLLRKVFPHLPGLLWLCDNNGKILISNESAGKSGGSCLPVLRGPEIRIDLAEILSSAGQSDSPIELIGLALENTQGDVQLADVRIVPLPDLFLITVVFYEPPRDVALQDAENGKLSGMTNLAAKIAHELNNPLDGSIRFVNLALRRLKAGSSEDKVNEYLSSAKDALGKINDVLSDLTSFARNGQSSIENLSINDMVEQAIRTLSARAKAEQVNFVTVFDDAIPSAGGTKMYQVFCNLLKNAIDAIAERRKKHPQTDSSVTITTEQGMGRVKITIEDSGVGLPADSQYLFDPFYSTKPAGKGTGLGLAISKEIVGQYNGIIRAEDAKSGGARFIIELPIMKGAKNAVS